ncbi:hypothetical protein ABZP36_023477 [Zizania latifolia]
MVVAMPMSIEQADEVSTYIVHVEQEHAAPPASPSAGDQNHIGITHYTSFLRGILPSHISEPAPSLIYAYYHAATGFVGRLSKRQAMHIKGHPGVLAVTPDERHELHTTLSPSFLHLSSSSGLVPASNGGAGAVIALLDTGVYPKDRWSFAVDPSLPPPPLTFRGRCVSTPSFNAAAYCNNKLVGAKYFYRGGSGQLYSEPISIGSFNAIRKGIFVSASAGNNGPNLSTALNLAPWIMTVGASSLNRRFPARVVLGNGRTYVGSSLFSGHNTAASLIPLVYGGDAGSDICFYGNLSRNTVAGKIVLCEDGRPITYSSRQEAAVRLAGGIGTIISNFRAILTYKRSVRNPVARMVFDGTTISQSPSAPRVAAFSSRGPNSIAAEILKPDVIAPGVEILAAWTGETAPSLLRLSVDNRSAEFNIISGTSMSCPHSSVNGQAAGPFELGSGHVDPNRALDPGLVYDATADDYITFLCNLNYTSGQIALFTKGSTVTDYCRTRPKTPVGDLNYPAFSVSFGRFGGRVTQRRAVTNVGANTNAVYDVNITAPPGTTLTVEPRRLAFNAQLKTLPYSVTLSAGAATKSSYEWGSIVWNDGQHKVRSPVVVTWA